MVGFHGISTNLNLKKIIHDTIILFKHKTTLEKVEMLLKSINLH